MIGLETNFTWFVIYSVIGWICEMIFCSVRAKKFVNRGFLNGPYCPIYGAGVMLMIAFLGGIENPIALFLTGAILTTTLEYITSWTMEKLFHARWWDYSNNFLNINGRICLLGAFIFGSMSVIAVRLIHPVLVTYTSSLSNSVISLIALCSFALMLTDTIYTVTRLSAFEAKLKDLSERLNHTFSALNERRMNERRRNLTLKRTDRKLYTRLTEANIDLSQKINRQERRIIKAFPKMRSVRYNEALEKVKQFVHRKEKDEARGKRTADTISDGVKNNARDL